jgi:cytochrome P450
MDVLFDPFSADFRRDPYAQLARLRATAPVHFIAPLNMWLLSRYRDVAFALRDDRFSSRRTLFERIAAERGDLSQLATRVAGTMIFRDPPDHTRLRNLVNKAFTPRVLEGLRPHVEQIARTLLDAAERKGQLELIGDFAFPLSLTVIAELLGVPYEDLEHLRTWSDDLAVLFDGTIALERLAPADRAMNELDAYLRAVVAERRRAPRHDLVSGLIAAREAGDKLSEDEMLTTCMLILIAGHETTTNLIGNGTLALLQHPDQLARLRDDPGLVRSAVEEMLRYDGPAQAIKRTLTEPVELDDKRMETGHEVVLLLGAANRDPARFPDPDRFDIAREDNRHLAFGGGLHFCIGALLARLEAQVTFPILVERFPRLRPTEAPLAWRDGLVLRGLRELPLAL